MITDPHLLLYFVTLLPQKEGLSIHTHLLQSNKNYAHFWTHNSEHVKKLFINIEKKEECTIYYLCGEKHRGGDLPAAEYTNGGKMWYKHGILHRGGDLPAIEHTDGSRSWYINGQYHRDADLPAIVYPDGTKFWFRQGKTHRDSDLPAQQWVEDGVLTTECWYKNGEQHREDGSAEVWDDGTLVWYKHGKIHRDGGLPAVMRADGRKQWFTHGVEYFPN